MPHSQTAADPRHQGRKGQTTARAKTTATKNAREAHRPALSAPREAYWAILLSFNFTFIVQTRPCTNEALIINYTELCYGWNRN